MGSPDQGREHSPGGTSLLSTCRVKKKDTCSFLCPCYCWQYFLPLRNCGGCCHISHLSLGTGRMLQAAHLGWTYRVITGSSWPWICEFLLQSSWDNMEAETTWKLRQPFLSWSRNGSFLMLRTKLMHALNHFSIFVSYVSRVQCFHSWGQWWNWCVIYVS